MHAVLVAVGLALTSVGYAVERQQPGGFNRGKAVGLTLYAVGVILLFGEGWVWGLAGLIVPVALINAAIAVTRRF